LRDLNPRFLVLPLPGDGTAG